MGSRVQDTRLRESQFVLVFLLSGKIGSSFLGFFLVIIFQSIFRTPQCRQHALTLWVIHSAKMGSTKDGSCRQSAGIRLAWRGNSCQNHRNTNFRKGFHQGYLFVNTLQCCCCNVRFVGNVSLISAGRAATRLCSGQNLIVITKATRKQTNQHTCCSKCSFVTYQVANQKNGCCRNRVGVFSFYKLYRKLSNMNRPVLNRLWKAKL